MYLAVSGDRQFKIRNDNMAYDPVSTEARRLFQVLCIVTHAKRIREGCVWKLGTLCTDGG